MLEAFLGERSSQIEELLAHYSSWAPVFKGQEELVLGFGLFEALHLMKNGHQKNREKHRFTAHRGVVTMNLHDLNHVLEANREVITAWMKKKRSEVPIPIYGSVDVRDAGWKIGVVDANHFPAGFKQRVKREPCSHGCVVQGPLGTNASFLHMGSHLPGKSHQESRLHRKHRLDQNHDSTSRLPMHGWFAYILTRWMQCMGFRARLCSTAS